MYSNVYSRITIDPSQFWKLIRKQTTTYSLVFPCFPLTRCLCFVKSLFIVYLPIYRVMIALGSPNAPWSYLPTNYPFAMQILVLLGIPIKLRFFPCSPPNPPVLPWPLFTPLSLCLSHSLFFLLTNNDFLRRFSFFCFFFFCHLIPVGSPDARLPATPFYFPSNRNFRITSVFVDVKTRILSHFHSNCYFFCFICTADIEPTRNGIVLGNLATGFRRYIWI